MNRLLVLVAATLACASALAEPPSPIRWEKLTLTDKYYCDGVTVADVNRDGHLDVIAGPFWYEGPDFKTAHPFYPPVALPPELSPSDSMFSFAYDFNGDGYPDILVLGRVHLHQAFWYENPGKEGLANNVMWKKHFVFERVKGESPPFVDVDGDGKPELVAHWENRWGFIQPDWADPTKPWQFHPITSEGKYEQFYHGTGIADVNGDGRPDLLLNDGWFEQPPKGSGQREWTFHPHKFGNKGGAQNFAYDVDGDGKPDVISAIDAHGWGLAWFKQLPDGNWQKNMIMGDRSEESKYGVAFTQPHALAMADLDGDGLQDVITGKRMWAHGPKGDIEPMATPVVYWFQLVRDKDGPRFVPHLIDDHSGVGTQIWTADVNGDGRIDVLTASKLGVFVFLNKPAK